MTDWNQAVKIVVNGFLAVFVIMGILAGLTSIVGKVLSRTQKSNKERA